MAPRMTMATRVVLGTLLSDVEAEWFGSQIGRIAGLPSGTVHPMLARLEGLGWVESRWEEIDTRAEGRPARRYYRLTASGVESARVALASSYQSRRQFGIARPAAEPS